MRKIINRHNMILALNILLGLLMVYFLSNINIGEIENVESLSFFTILAVFVASAGWAAWKKYGYQPAILVFSFLFLLCLITGMIIRCNGNAGAAGHWPLILGAAITGAPAVSLPIHYLCHVQILKEDGKTGRRSNKFYFWIDFGILMIAWFPIFLAYYPGVFAYDVGSQIKQYLEADYTMHHPLLHTFILGVFYSLGEALDKYNWGVALYSLFQMGISALIMSYALLYLRKVGVNIVTRFIILGFFAIWPINSIMVISTTKDVFFSVAVLLFIVVLLQFLSREEIKVSSCIVITGVGILVYLLRNNAMYVFFVWGIIFVCCMLFSKQPKKKSISSILILCGILLLGNGLNLGMQSVTNAESSSVKEMLSVPDMQMARCLALEKENLDEDLYGAYEKLGITDGPYRISLADGLKSKVAIEGQEKLFFETWVATILKYPETCIDAFLYLNQGNIFLDDISHAKIYDYRQKERQGYLLTDTKSGFGVEHKTKFSFLENIYEKLFSENKYQKIPVIATLFVPAFYFWLLMFTMLHAFVNKNYKIIYVGLFLFIYYLTVLLGPCSLIRYMYPLVVSVPVLLGIELHGQRVFSQDDV